MIGPISMKKRQAQPEPAAAVNGRPARIWWADDHRDFRESCAGRLEVAYGFLCDHRFDSVEELIAALGGTSVPDIVLLEYGLRGVSGSAAVKLIKACSPATLVFILSSYKSHRHVAEALASGASGYFEKSDSLEALIIAMRGALRSREAVAEGEVGSFGFSP